MATDQLEIIGPGGEIKFHDLNPLKGLTNIGRHPENDIVIDGPNIGLFHAVLDHRQKPFHIVLLAEDVKTIVGGQPLTPNVAHEIHSWDTIELDGHSLILLEASGAPQRGGEFLPGGAEPEGYSYSGYSSASASSWETPVAQFDSSFVSSSPAASSSLSAIPSPTPLVTALPATLSANDQMSRIDEVLARLDKLAELPGDHADNLIVAEFHAQDFSLDPDHPATLDFGVEVEQSATLQVTVINGGDIVATFEVKVEGLDPGWVKVTPAQVNLFEGERATVNITLTAPRSPASLAGAHQFAVVVTSPNYQGRMSSATGMVLVKPFYDFSVGDISPKQQTIGYSKRTGQVTVPVVNRGNSEALFRVEAEDDERGCRFEFKMPGEETSLARQAEFRVPPNSLLTVPVDITPLARRLIGFRKHNYPFTVTTTPLEGQQTPRSVIGQAQSGPLIGPWTMALVLLLLVALVIFIFRPTISYFGADPDLVSADPVLIKAGQSVALHWRTSQFVNLRIDPDLGIVQRVPGTMVVSPTLNTNYKLVAENFLTRLSPRFFSASRELQIFVDPVLPSIDFKGVTASGTTDSATNTIEIVRGQSVTLSWIVHFADELILSTNGAPETIPADQRVGSRTVTPDADTTYILTAHNIYTGENGEIAKVTIKVLEPTATPLPVPIIQRFDVQPLVITDGQSIKLEWAVVGVDTVSITPLGTDFAPNGTIEVSPKETTTYLLIATNGKDSVQLSRQVIVNPAPTEAPPPEAPKIEFFTVTPAEVVLGSLEANNVVLAWSVTGKVTNVEISGPDFGKVSNLDSKGSITIAAVKSTLFILTASNGPDLNTSQTVQIKVNLPTPTMTPSPAPTPTPSQTPSATPLPLPIIIFSAAPDTGQPANSVNPLPGDATTYKYEVVAGTRVKFNWSVTNAVKVTFLSQDKAPIDSATLQVLAADTYVFAAINAQGASVNVFVQIQLKAKPIPPAPFNVNGPGIAAPQPWIITWDYDPNSLADIEGFRFYRATLPNLSFVALPDVGTSPLQYQDPGGTCGMAYYIVALYRDVNNDLQETAASSNSWYSPPCPPPTATP